MQKTIHNIITKQKEFFRTGSTKDVSFRKKYLQLLLDEVIKKEKDIIDAVYKDFKKSEYEAILTETSTIISDLKRTLDKIDYWSRSEWVMPSLMNFPSSAKIHKEPYGMVLIIAPWNYPYQLAMAPLIGALVAGNTVVVKPSELTPNTSQIIKEIIESVFDKKYVAVVEGGVSVSEQLLAERWDYIFFTGSVKVGKIVAQAAAQYLTPVTLELGGKSPCIVDPTANIDIAVKRIVWGKYINAGQTCIAPDYVLVHADIKQQFIIAFKKELERAYGKNPEQSPDFPRIINQKNWERLSEMLVGQDIIIGGEKNKDNNYISPTVINEPDLKSKVMSEEIFGPILPIISYENETDIKKIISQYEKPLAFYIFSENKKFAQKMIDTYSFGGGVINDTVVHFGNHNLPFGGVGESGIGAYHGQASFDTFSHSKGVVTRYNWLDINLKYAPYKRKAKRIRKLLKLF